MARGHFFRSLLIVVAGLGFAGDSVAQTEQDRDDARCYVVLQMLGVVGKSEGLLSVEDRDQVDVMSAYFLGKIRGRNPAHMPITAIITPDIAKEAVTNYMMEGGACIEEGSHSQDSDAFLGIFRDALRQVREDARGLPKNGS